MRIGHGLSKTAEDGILLSVIVYKAEGPRRIECDVAAFPRGLDSGRNAREREALINVAACHAKAFGDFFGGRALCEQRRERIGLVHGVHRDAMHVFDERDLLALLTREDVARHREVIRNHTGLHQQFEREVTPAARINFEAIALARHDAKVL